MATRLIQQNETQEKILNVAAQLFYEKGVQAVSVGDIILHTGIAKMTLYKYFISKDQLIMAVVERSEKLWWEWFNTELNRRSKTASKQLLTVFDLLADSFQQNSYKSKTFIGINFQFLETKYPIFLIPENFLDRLREVVLGIVRLANISSPHQVTDHFILLAVGLIGLNILPSSDDTKLSKTSLQNTKKLATLILTSATQN